MKKLILLLLLFWTCGDKVYAGIDETPVIDPTNTYVFMSGVLQWQSPTLSSFNKRNRKDEELYNLLLSKGVKKENTVFLADNQATLANMKTRMKELLQQSKEGSVFIFYYAGHGVRGGNGPVCFANYDYTSGNGFEVSVVSELISAHFKGSEIWLLADCCYSGSLLGEAKKIGAKGKKVICFTSSTSCNISTGNWTFTQTMIDCFSGLGLCDRNGDGKISLAETKSELFDAMKYREKQLSGTVFYNTDESVSLSLGVAAKNNVKSIRYVYVQQNTKFEPARVLSETNTAVTGELYHYSDKVQVTVPAGKTKEIAFAEYPVGLKVQVEWNGKYYPAEIKETKGGFHYIHYTGYDDSWNEWVMYDRILTADRKKCTIEWQGAWYPGEVLQQKDGKYFVHYTGYGNDWDEWVGPGRVRL
ncbi:MAG: caspase family protein [Chitinophagaceae bacterium]|nr:caspase family protein [Chitinophagaceae bacterium]